MTASYLGGFSEELGPRIDPLIACLKRELAVRPNHKKLDLSLVRFFPDFVFSNIEVLCWL